MKRGGVIMLVREPLLRFVKRIDMGTEGQIWLTLALLITIRLGGIYIPPQDSPYFDQSHWGALTAHSIAGGERTL